MILYIEVVNFIVASSGPVRCSYSREGHQNEGGGDGLEDIPGRVIRTRVVGTVLKTNELTRKPKAEVQPPARVLVPRCPGAQGPRWPGAQVAR